MSHEPIFHIAKENKQIRVDRDFDAPLELVL